MARLHSQQHLTDLDRHNQHPHFTHQAQHESADLQSAAHTSYQVDTLQQAHSMAQAMFMSQQYQLEDDVASPQWPQTGFPQNYTPTPNAIASPGYTTGGATSVPNNGWGGARMGSGGFYTNNASDMPQYPTSTAGLGYSSTAFFAASMQDFGNQGMAQFKTESWAPAGSDGRRPRSVDESGVNSDYSLSPRSCTSETASPGGQPFTPESAVATSPHTDWRSNLPSQLAIKASTSPVLTAQDYGNLASRGWGEQLPTSMGDASPPFTPSEPRFDRHGLLTPDGSSQDGEQRFESNHSGWGSQESLHNRVLAHRPLPTPQTHRQAYTGGPAQSQHQNSDFIGQSREVMLYNSARAPMPAPRYQHRFQAHTMDAQAIRKADDQILLEGKRDGLTYKEIRMKMHAQPAESTLRGRFRSLTKPRQQRVRKPVWIQKDIELLKDCVQSSLRKIDRDQPSLGYYQRLAKVQWKKIADQIATQGGSYHFGNSTCKRKWVEISRGR